MKVAYFFLKETQLYLDQNKFATFCQFFPLNSKKIHHKKSLAKVHYL